ncbi:MAG TPA: metallophosphoesterase family protein [Kofleriaceae bacterium]|nr:metallophosphoesterase family protein [Kofleriaceae bacterium]
MELTIGVHDPEEEAATPATPAVAPDRDTVRFSAIIDLLMSFAHVDGGLDLRAQAFVRQYVETVVLMLEQASMEPPEVRAQQLVGWRAHFHELETSFGHELAGMPPARLRERVLALFRGLSWSDRATVLELIPALLHADGTVSADERALYELLAQELSGGAAATAPAVVTTKSDQLIIHPPVTRELTALSHPLLDPLEQTYSPHPVERKAQVDWDYHLVQQAMMAWYRQRAAGAGRLAGLDDIEQLPAGSRFLDGFVHVMRPDKPLELIVLGDLHGCYSCLKAALLQSNFIERAWAHQWDPERYPDVKLVFLGDYIDRGRFSFDGVMRAALQLFVAMPDQVILLRGNHEWLRWQGDRIASGVYPAEALASIVPHVPIEMLEAYRQMFEAMPTALACDRTLLVHAGMPRWDTFESKYRGLASLNDPEIRFQMMWSDPGPTNHIPVEMQRENPRFTFGRDQFRAFMERSRMTTLIRGHEQIDRGFDVFYDLDKYRLLTLFSAGGSENADLPADSSYRAVTPMALSLQFGEGTPTATPWPIQYQPFNFAPHNGLYRPQPVLEFRYTY